MKLTRRQTLAAAMAASGVALLPQLARAQEKVIIGYSGPLSGGAAFYGKNVLDGVKLAADEVNEKGLEVAGKPVQFEVIALDDQYNPSQTAINAQRLVQQNKANVVVVPHSGGIFAVQARNESQKLLLLAHSSLPEITSRGNKLTVELPANITNYVTPFINYAMPTFGPRVGVAITDSDYGKTWSKIFTEHWEAAGGEIAIENLLSYNKSADFYSGVSRVLAAKPDVMFIGGPSEPTGLVLKQARELGFKGGIILIDQAKADEMVKIVGSYDVLGNAIGLLPLELDSDPSVKAFVERYRRIYPDRIPSLDFALPYTATHALAEAMKLAETTTDSAAIRANMDAGYKALPPSVNFLDCRGVDETGLAILDVRLAIIKDGEVTEVKASELAG